MKKEDVNRTKHSPEKGAAVSGSTVVLPNTTDFSVIEDSADGPAIIAQLAKAASRNAAAAARALNRPVTYVKGNEVICYSDGKETVISKSVRPVKKYLVGTVLHARAQ